MVLDALEQSRPTRKLPTWRGMCPGERATGKKLGAGSTLNHWFLFNHNNRVGFSITIFLLRDKSKALNKQRNCCSCLGISEAESKSLSWVHENLDIPYPLSKWTKEEICEWNADPSCPVCSWTQVDVLWRDGVASQFASKSSMHSEEIEKLVIASFPDCVRVCLIPHRGWQRTTETGEQQ